MSVKASTSVRAPSRTYPKLMVSSVGTVVLFERPTQGTVVGSSTKHIKVGEHSSNWDMSNFTDYSGSVTLENSND